MCLEDNSKWSAWWQFTPAWDILEVQEGMHVRRMLVFPLLLAASQALSQDYQSVRERMVKDQIEARGVRDARVLAAMRAVERHLFVPENIRWQAYNDSPLPIGEGQTISQPYIVAYMTEALGLRGGERVLEIGTGSGYQAAVLSCVVKEVFTIEIKKPLYAQASRLLASLGYENVTAECGDGYFGWKDKAPFDCIMITAAVNHIPPPLLAQLKDGGRMILPLGNPFSYQSLILVTRKGESYATDTLMGVLFVPMTGQALQGHQ
jgi:protein-L-isoaspartate(D-aspartate) O-methyltransferase